MQFTLLNRAIGRGDFPRKIRGVHLPICKLISLVSDTPTKKPDNRNNVNKIILSLHMVKAITTYTLIAFLAALVFYGGGGVNFISYCCDNCRAEGMEAVAHDSCCGSHEHSCGSDSCESLNETGCCTLTRVCFDWSQAVHPVFSFQPVVSNLTAPAALPATSPVPGPDLVGALFPRLNGPPLLIRPRAYLSLLTTLLI